MVLGDRPLLLVVWKTQQKHMVGLCSGLATYADIAIDYCECRAVLYTWSPLLLQSPLFLRTLSAARFWSFSLYLVLMEALTALSLAANVIQFVQFSCGLISLSSSIRNSTEGSAADLVDLEVIAKDVARHHSRLRNSAHVNRDLETLAERSSDIAKDLLDVIERVRVKRSKITRWGSFRQALETVWKKDQISGLQSRLESLRDEIQYHLIVDMQ